MQSMAGVVQEEEHPQQQQQQQQEEEEEEDLRPIQHRYRLIALLGASMVLYSVAGNGKPSMQQQAHVDAGCAVTGFLLWLSGATRLLPFTQVGLHHLFSAGLAATTAKFSLVLERMKRLFSSRQGPAVVPA